ncbi:MAG TPA: ABC transporter permease [Anaerolineales bacterium]
MFLARKHLLQDRTRLALNITGVALAVMLILLLNGFLTGMLRQITSYLDRSPGEIVVAQSGVRNLLGATSVLPAETLGRAEGVEGVESVIPILSQFVILDLHGKRQPAYMIGYDPERGGGPWALSAGREPQTDTEAVFDRVLAERHSLGLGDEVDVMGKTLTVVGLSEETTSWMTSFFFLRKSAAEDLVRLPGATSFLLVEVEPGVPPAEAREGLERLGGVEALTKEAMGANDRNLFGRFFSAPVRLMVGIAFLVGTLVVGLVIYTATVEREREYGVLKAIGARNGVLFTAVGAQALYASFAGVIGGIALALGASQAIMALRPQFLIVMIPADVVGAGLVGLGMALAAALVPARLVGGLAPAEVFRR